MSVRLGRLAHRGRLGGTVTLATALCGCAQLPPRRPAAVPAVPAGMARVWFTRDDSPHVEIDQSYVRMNGAILGITEPGGAFYRDVAPGQYKITVDTYGIDVSQFPQGALAAGQVAYFKILESRTWASGGASTNWERPTFYVWPMPAPVAADSPVLRR